MTTHTKITDKDAMEFMVKGTGKVTQLWNGPVDNGLTERYCTVCYEFLGFATESTRVCKKHPKADILVKNL